MLDRGIKNHPDDAKYHYSKAAALKKLSEIIINNERYAEALTSFNRAIELDSENLLYIIKRAELLVAMNRGPEAFNDLQTATELAKNILAKQLGDLSIEEMATVNAIRDIVKLNLQETVEHKAEPVSEQASVVFHLPKSNEGDTTSFISYSSKAESNERLIPEEQAESEIAGLAESYNIYPYCGY